LQSKNFCRVNGAHTLMLKSKKAKEDSFVPTIKVEVKHGDAGQNEFTFDTTFRIGRDDTCHVQFDDPIISRYHAEVYYEQQHWWIRDLGSANGTFVGGEKIDRYCLREPSRVELGRDGPIIVLRVEGMSENYSTDIQKNRRVERMGLAKTLGEIQRQLKPERAILIGILALMAIIGQGIIIYAVYTEKHLSALFGISIDSFAIWPINRLWQITKDLMAIGLASSMLRNAKLESEKSEALELGNQVVLSILEKK